MQSDFQKSQNQNEKLLIELLQQQLTTKDRQIAEYQEQIKVYQRQIDKLTDSLNDTTQALSAAQALHAGTIQKQLTAQINNEESAPEQEEQHPKKRGIFSKFFHSDDKKWKLTISCRCTVFDVFIYFMCRWNRLDKRFFDLKQGQADFSKIKSYFFSYIFSVGVIPLDESRGYHMAHFPAKKLAARCVYPLLCLYSGSVRLSNAFLAWG